MEQYYYTIQSSKETNIKMIAFLLEHDPEDYETIDEMMEDDEYKDYSVTIERNGTGRVDLLDVCYMDLINVYEDPRDREMFYKFASIAAFLGESADYEISFSFESSPAEYSHFGKCKFDGKRINYNDTVMLGPYDPIDHTYTGEIINGRLCNDVYEGWFHMSGERAPDTIPEEYFNF